MSAIRIDVRQLLPEIKKEEVARTASMTLLVFLILTSYLILKPVRDSLFLTRVGPNQLPVIYILIAAISGFIAQFYAWFAARMKLNRMIFWTYAVILGFLVIFRWLFSISNHAALFYGFYVWVSIYGVITTSQFWLLANHVFNPREAKRLFSYLSSGAIVGGIAGGFITRALVGAVGGTENLLFIVGIMLTFGYFLMRVAWNRRPETEPAKKKGPKDESLESKSMFPIIGKSPHLIYLTAIISLMVMVSTFVDFQFKIAATEAYPEKDQLTAFLGTLFSTLSVISLCLQLVLGPRLIRTFGLGAAMFFLPVGLLLGSAAMFFWPVLASAMILKVSDGSLRYSINKVGLELLYLPVPLAIKDRVKTFIDMFADRFARGIGGAVLLVLASILHVEVSVLSIPSVLIILAWFYCIVRMRQVYLNSFRVTLERRELNLDQISTSLRNPEALRLLEERLLSKDEKQALYALETLSEIPEVDLEEIAPRVLEETTPRVAARLLGFLGEKETGGFQDKAKELLETAVEIEDRALALDYLIHVSGDQGEDVLEVYLTSGDERHWTAAVEAICRHSDRDLSETMEDRLIQLLGSEDPDKRKLARRLVSRVAAQHPVLGDFIEPFLEDPDTVVVRGVLQSLGRSQNRRYVPRIIEMLPFSKTRRDAVLALAAYGEKVAGTLQDYLIDPQETVAVRRAIPSIYTQMGTQSAAEFLVRSLGRADAAVEFRIIAALNKLKRNHPDIELPRDRMSKRVIEETRRYYRVARILERARSGSQESRSARLLQRALSEKLDRNLEVIFRLLGLIYPPRDIYSAFLGITSSRKDLRANAVEFLDNLLAIEIKRFLIPIVEDSQLASIARRGEGLLREPTPALEEGIRTLLGESDRWIRVCAIFFAGESDLSAARDLVKKARRDPSRLVRETAYWVLGWWKEPERSPA